MQLFLKKKVPTTTSPSKEQNDSGDTLVAEIKVAECHNKLESDESGKKRTNNEEHCSLYEGDNSTEESPFQRHTGNITAEGSGKRSIGDALASGIEDVEGYNEALQQITDIAADLPFRYLEFASTERNQRNSALHRTKEDFPIQESSIHSAANVANGSEQKDNDEALQQTADITQNLVSRCFELLDFQNSPRLGIVSVQEGFEDMSASGIEYAKFYEALQVVVDIAAKLVSRCFDFELRFDNQQRVKETALRTVCEDTFAHHGVRKIQTNVANSTKQESVRYESASAKSKEAIRQIADIAINLLCRSSKLQTRIQTKSQSYPPVH